MSQVLRRGNGSHPDVVVLANYNAVLEGGRVSRSGVRGDAPGRLVCPCAWQKDGNDRMFKQCVGWEAKHDRVWMDGMMRIASLFVG